jgi:valyl-tRNA synthetase
MTIDKTFDPAAIEARWYAHWEDKGLFRPERLDAEPFTIVIPPPNVTGSLHIGHALDDTLQDVLVRHARLKGKDALWVVGTDHAGIATQMVVERQLNAKGQKRTDFDRDAFIAKVWEWKEESGGTITRQLRRLGASCDWANERFTMDEGFSRAVLKVFVDLYNQGLLYRDKRLVNWDPGLKTAISDLEVETKEVQGHFWHFSYPLADGSGTISVATTRPETMLADMAVAVNPEDERYKVLIGKQVRLPITGRLIPIVADEHADPELGSGAVKITPGHDFNDFEVGKRAGFKPAEMLNMLDADAKVVQTSDGLIPADYLGLDRFEARKMVVAAIEAAGLLEKIEDRVIQTPKGDRSGAVIEPWLTDQWYVDAETLAKPAIEAVRSGTIRIVPESWSKTYFNWLENIQPWCVSRQLWWGHQIPAWYDEDGNVFVAENEEEAKALAGGKTLTRDPDVLDTWFSSALWPFGTLGWPEGSGQQAPEAYRDGEAKQSLLQRHYPNDVLISGFDILFFWDARMIMQGLHFMGEAPFKTLYLHGLVRAADGSKMSKSKGNTVDPLGLIDKYGADALRFTLTAMESQGRDIKLDEKRVEGYRNFATKLWNAARFAQGNGIGASNSIEAPAAQLAVNRWIVAETMKTVKALDRAIEDLRYDEAANTIYHFVWASFCDWYIELSKPLLGEGADPVQAAETRAVAGWVLDQILVMLHPFMPFITEELWHALGDRPYELILAKWPVFDESAIDADAQAQIGRVIEIISEIRTQRVAIGISPSARLAIGVLVDENNEIGLINRNKAFVTRMARVIPAAMDYEAVPDQQDYKMEMGTHQFSDDFVMIDNPSQYWATSVQIPTGGLTFVVGVDGFADLDAERARLTKAIAAAEKERDGLANRLNNPAFVEKAKPEAVEKARADHAEKSLEAEQLSAALARLG